MKKTRPHLVIYSCFQSFFRPIRLSPCRRTYSLSLNGQPTTENDDGMPMADQLSLFCGMFSCLNYSLVLYFSPLSLWPFALKSLGFSKIILNPLTMKNFTFYSKIITLKPTNLHLIMNPFDLSRTHFRIASYATLKLSRGFVTFLEVPLG